MEVVLDGIIQMKKDGVPYPRLKKEWEKKAFELYPNEWKLIQFPSRTTLWQLSKEYDFIICPLCNKKIPREESVETFLIEPTPHWDKICKQCYINKKTEYWKNRGYSPFLEDYVIVKRGNYSSENYSPRREIE
jgi:hypothetical protein